MLRKEANTWIVIPENESFVHAAGDNINISEKTLDGKRTTHPISIVLYQMTGGGDHNDCQRDDRPTSQQDLHQAPRARVISNTPTCVKLLPYNKSRNKSTSPTRLHNLVSTNQHEQLPASNRAELFDLSWILLWTSPQGKFQLNIESPQTQKIPCWSAFNRAITKDGKPITKLGYCPIIQAAASHTSTIYTVLKYVQKSVKHLGQKLAVVIFDEAYYSKTQEIVMNSRGEFADTILRLGGFHTCLVFLAILGKRYERSSMEDIFIESGIYGTSVVSAMMTGKPYNRALRAHKLLSEAMQRVMLNNFFSGTKQVVFL